MDWDAIDDVIRAKFKVLADAQSWQVQYDNDGSFSPPKDEVWARLHLLPGVDAQQDLGDAKTTRSPGLMVVQLFAPLRIGTDAMKKVAQLIRAEFKQQTANGVTWRTPFPTNLGRVRDGWQYNVTCPYFSDDVES